MAEDPETVVSVSRTHTWPLEIKVCATGYGDEGRGGEECESWTATTKLFGADITSEASTIRDAVSNLIERLFNEMGN